MGFKGPIDLKDPEIQIGIFEDHETSPNFAGQDPPGKLLRIWVGRKVIGSLSLAECTRTSLNGKPPSDLRRTEKTRRRL
jgi:hypothetical protein